MLLSNRKRINLVKWILMLIIVLIVGGVILVFINDSETESTSKPDTNGNNDSQEIDGEQKMAGLIQEYWSGEKKIWVLKADSMKLTEQNTMALLKSPKVTYFMEDAQEAVLTADSGKYHMEKKHIKAAGNVVIEYDQFTLTTEVLRFNSEKQRVSIEKPLTITGQSFTLRADRMDLNVKSKTARFKGNVVGEFYETLDL